MNKDNAKQFLPLVQALADGKTIQIRTQKRWDGGEEVWTDMSQNEIGFLNEPDTYRVKPEEPKEIEAYHVVEVLRSNKWVQWSTYDNKKAAESTYNSLTTAGREKGVRLRKLIPEKV